MVGMRWEEGDPLKKWGWVVVGARFDEPREVEKKSWSGQRQYLDVDRGLQQL